MNPLSAGKIDSDNELIWRGDPLIPIRRDLAATFSCVYLPDIPDGAWNLHCRAVGAALQEVPRKCQVVMNREEFRATQAAERIELGDSIPSELFVFGRAKCRAYENSATY